MISVIIPAHNEKENLQQLLPQLSKMIGKVKAEIIVVLSPDSTTDLGSELKRIKIYKSPKKGRAVQMNYGATKANGSSLAFLHADVRPPYSFLEDIEQTLITEYDAGFFSYRFDKESLFLRINSRFTATDGIFTGGGDQCLFIKKPLFLKLGAFCEKQVIMEDFEFFKRMKKNKVRYRIIKNDLIVSARKYQDNSYVRVNLSNLLLIILFRMGYPATKLKLVHDKLLRMS